MLLLDNVNVPIIPVEIIAKHAALDIMEIHSTEQKKIVNLALA